MLLLLFLRDVRVRLVQIHELVHDLIPLLLPLAGARQGEGPACAVSN